MDYLKPKKEHKCDECKYEYLSKEEHPCSVCRWRFKDRKLVVLGSINYFEPKEEKGLNQCIRCKYEHDSAIDEPCVSCSKASNYVPKEGKECGLNDDDLTINKPPHYLINKIQPIDYIDAQHFNFNLGNVIKYISRAPFKGNELEDLKKARWYLDREIQKKEKEEEWRKEYDK